MADKTRIPVNGVGGRSRPAPGPAAEAGRATRAGQSPSTKKEGVSTKPPADSTRKTEGGASNRSAAHADATSAQSQVPPAESRSSEATAARIEELEKAVAEASRARDEYLDGLQRLQAEFDNYRRRVRREMNEASDTARVALLADFLPVLDNLERALSAAEHHEEGKVLEGVRLTRSQFVELLRREGVEEVDPLGGTFDPTVHEAMLARPADEPEGTVIDVFEKGYTVGGTRVLRPARVVVSSGTSSTAD